MGEKLQALEEEDPDKALDIKKKFARNRDTRIFGRSIDLACQAIIDKTCGASKLTHDLWLRYQFLGGVPREVAQSQWESAMEGDPTYTTCKNSKGEWCIEVEKAEEVSMTDRTTASRQLGKWKPEDFSAPALVPRPKRYQQAATDFFKKSKMLGDIDNAMPVDDAERPAISGADSWWGAGSWGDSWWGADDTGADWSSSGWDWGAGEEAGAGGTATEATSPVIATPKTKPAPAPSETGSIRRKRGLEEALPTPEDAIETINGFDEMLRTPKAVWLAQQCFRSYIGSLFPCFKVVRFSW